MTYPQTDSSTHPQVQTSFPDPVGTAEQIELLAAKKVEDMLASGAGEFNGRQYRTDRSVEAVGRGVLEVAETLVSGPTEPKEDSEVEDGQDQGVRGYRAATVRSQVPSKLNRLLPVKKPKQKIHATSIITPDQNTATEISGDLISSKAIVEPTILEEINILPEEGITRRTAVKVGKTALGERVVEIVKHTTDESGVPIVEVARSSSGQISTDPEEMERAKAIEDRALEIADRVAAAQLVKS